MEMLTLTPMVSGPVLSQPSHDDHLKHGKPARLFGHFFEDPYHYLPFHHGEHIIHPKFDFRESDEAYFLEGEFPGIAKKEDIQLEWAGERTLVVNATVEKVDLEKNGVLGTENAFKRQPTDEMVDPALAQNHKSKKHDPQHTIGRRKGGLLKILIPKAEPTELKRKKIEIDVLNFY
ncbi:hypothetical protein H2203_001277 [Taxawa tesnikishii (nom. ined.)]|nr:hypothetical protein H2203_001277 [Dothideales sp. JES 119]